MHIFIYHFGFFLNQYGGIKKFANYALEGKHQVTKRILAYRTSGLGGKGGEPKAAKQQLQALLCDEVHATKRQRLEAGKPKSWAKKSLSADSDVAQFVISSTHM